MTFIADETLNPEAFSALATERDVTPRRARKAARIAAVQAERRQKVVTRWDGEETTNAAEPGDWIATALGRDGAPLRDDAGELNQYVITADVFSRSYGPVEAKETVHGAVYAKSETVLAIPLPEGFDILAPWGERQRADSGYLLLSGDEVYGNAKETFEATYEFVDQA